MRPNTRDAYEFFKQGTLALATVEANGIRVDTAYLDQAIKNVSDIIEIKKEKLKKSEVWKEWRKRFKEPKLTSDKQLGEVLFNVMGIKGGRPTQATRNFPKGDPQIRYKVDESELERIDHPFIKLYLSLKKMNKVKGTYLTGIKREVVDGLLHPSYNLAGGMDDEQKGGAMSYRSSCSDPNFTNMPIRNKMMGKIIRQCFISRGDDYLLGEVDYKIQEVKIAACVTKDPKLIEYVTDPSKDMHRDAAFLLFSFTKEMFDQLTPTGRADFKTSLRDASKNKFVFPQFYGSYYLDCAASIWKSLERNNWNMPDSKRTVLEHLAKHGIKELGKCDEDSSPRPGTFEYRVQQVENTLWNEWFIEYTAWKKRWYNQYLESGEVYMPTGFVASGAFRRNQVLNLPIQGPAFHCLLWSIIQINKELKRKKMRSMIVGQIHDCMLPDIHKNEVQDFLHIAKRVMTVDLPKAWPWIIVPLEIEVDIVPEGKTWNDKEPYILDKGTWRAKS